MRTPQPQPPRPPDPEYLEAARPELLLELEHRGIERHALEHGGIVPREQLASTSKSNRGRQ